jgi:hypothetical protein
MIFMIIDKHKFWGREGRERREQTSISPSLLYFFGKHLN